MMVTSAIVKRLICVVSSLALERAELIEKEASMATASKVGASHLGRLRVP
jgi:hypothetical protein